jgi:aldose sugar dehydrogenase
MSALKSARVSLAMLACAAAPAFAGQTNAPAPAAPSKVAVETVTTGLKNPWALEFLPDGRMLVTERTGQLRVVSKDGKAGAPVAGVPKVVARGQGGLLDVAMSPDFATTSLIFLSYSEPREDGGNGTSVLRAKLVLSGDSGTLEEARVIFQQQPAIASTYHFGSRIAFASDGTLFVTMGDRNSERDQAQNPANHIGKIVRITPDGAPAESNPKLEGWDPTVWSIGHRNVQGAAIDPVTGALWTVEHGARGGDELNRPEAGKNYGWPVISYGREYIGLPIGEGKSKPGLEQPVYYWDPSIATSGLLFYTGDLFPDWRGNAFVGGLRGAHLHRLVMKDGAVTASEKLLETLEERIRDVKQAPDGALWVVTDDDRDGKLLRLTPGA